MHFSWDGYVLDRDGALLTRRGQHIAISRKVLDCICELIQHRERPVTYDELTRAIWRHGDVSHHQLAQVILAARRCLDDDGQTQRLIRTLPGIGYQWVQAIDETTEAPALTKAPVDNTSIARSQLREPEHRALASEPSHASTAFRTPPPIQTTPHASFRTSAFAALAILLAALTATSIARRSQDDITDIAPTHTEKNSRKDPLAPYWDAFAKGRFEEAALGLASLPAGIGDTPDAGLLEINLHIERGRFAEARAKLVREQTRAAEAADPIWQSRLFSVEAILNGTAGKPGQEILAPAQFAIRLLEDAGETSITLAMGEALSARGYGLMKSQQYEAAIRDLTKARTTLLEAGELRTYANTTDTLARVYMRTERLHEALSLFAELISFCERTENPVQEIYARNAATKIQIELLRWDDALANNERARELLKAMPESERKTRVLMLHTLALTGVGRIREAGSVLNEATSFKDDRYSTITAATFHLAAGDMRRAMQAATEAETYDAYGFNDMLNLESKEGALLLKLTAADALSQAGETVPPVTGTELETLQWPKSSIGHVARGRWLRSIEKPQEAELAFREALRQATAKKHLSRMLLATEPLIELLLERGDVAAAKQVMTRLWSADPHVLSKDYRANLLSLRVALAEGNRSEAIAMYRKVNASAGERGIPPDIEKAYQASHGAGYRRSVAGR